MCQFRFIVSSRFSTRFAIIVHAAVSTIRRHAPRLRFADVHDLLRRFRVWPRRGPAAAPALPRRARNSSASGLRLKHGAVQVTRSAPRSSCPPRLMMRSASARAASKCCTSFISCSACSGVLVRSRTAQSCSRFGRVEVGQERGRGGALDEHVEAAAVQRFAVVLQVVARVAVAVADRLPDVRRLVRLHAAAAHLRG